MRLFLLGLLLLSACTGEWGDWMQAEKPDEDHQYFCQYYDQCGKGEGKAIYRSDHNVAKAGGGVYEIDKNGIWGGKKDEGGTVWGPSSTAPTGNVWGPAQ